VPSDGVPVEDEVQNNESDEGGGIDEHNIRSGAKIVPRREVE